MTATPPMAPRSSGPLPEHVSVLVVGAGFGGLGMAVKLQEAGERDFLVIERGQDVGGTWRDNTYPGAACDVPSHLYSFSFAPNPDWTRSFSPQPEIWAYLRRCARDSGVRYRFRFGHRVDDAAWDEGEQVWRRRHAAAGGGEVSIVADVLVTAMGALEHPQVARDRRDHRLRRARRSTRPAGITTTTPPGSASP